MIDDLKRNSDKDDESQIFFNRFLGILSKYGAKLSTEEKSELINAFPGREGGDDAAKYGKRMNIARIYDQKYNMMS